MAKPKLLWVGDAVVASGFAKCTHEILAHVQRDWDVHILGLNYLGDPHTLPWPVYPCWPGGDGFGVKRMKTICQQIRPDLVLVQNDPWNIGTYLKVLENLPCVAVMPVDGKNCRGRELNGLKHAIWWTAFGQREAEAGGYTGPSSVIPLGVDLKRYTPSPFSLPTQRREAGLPEETLEAFVVGNVNRNQPRKRIDLTIEYFCTWVKEFDVQDALLFLHVAPTGDQGVDIRNLFRYYGLSKRLMLSEPPIGMGVPEQAVLETYRCFDVQVTTTQGEGWGLTQMEGMACGIPQIAPDWAALGEWGRDAICLIPSSGHSVTPGRATAIGCVPSKEKFIEALHGMYSSEVVRADWKRQGLARVQEPQYRWDAIGAQYLAVLEEVRSAL